MTMEPIQDQDRLMLELKFLSNAKKKLIMQRIKTILIILGVFTSGSCDLTEVDTVADITNEQCCSTQADVESYLFGIYNKMRNEQNTTSRFEDRGDTFVPGLEAGLTTAWNQNLPPPGAP